MNGSAFHDNVVALIKNDLPAERRDIPIASLFYESVDWDYARKQLRGKLPNPPEGTAATEYRVEFSDKTGHMGIVFPRFY
jgi:hypothetical protein